MPAKSMAMISVIVVVKKKKKRSVAHYESCKYNLCTILAYGEAMTITMTE